MSPNFINSGNVSLDSLLNAKIKIIRELNINLETYIFIEKDNQIEDIDLCILLGNAIDNSIEACEKILSGNEKKIKIEILQVEEYLSIKISNSTFRKVEIIEGSIFTTKKDKLLHGFGLESINRIVDKYDGHINYSQQENIFTIKILLQNPITSPISQI